MASKSSEPVREKEFEELVSATIDECVTDSSYLFTALDVRQKLKDDLIAAHRAAKEASTNGDGSGNDKLPLPSLPVESLEATVIDCLDSARKGDDPNALGYYLMGEIDKALQKARIDGAAKFVEEGWGKRCKTKDLEDFPELTHDPKGSRCGTCEMWEHYDEWVKELREEEA